MGWPGPMTFRQYLIWHAWFEIENERQQTAHSLPGQSPRPKGDGTAVIPSQQFWLAAAGARGKVIKKRADGSIIPDG